MTADVAHGRWCSPSRSARMPFPERAPRLPPSQETISMTHEIPPLTGQPCTFESSSRRLPEPRAGLAFACLHGPDEMLGEHCGGHNRR